VRRAFVSLVAVMCTILSVGVPRVALAAAITPENAGQVVELKRVGEPIVNSAVISPDGRLVAVATSLAIELRDATKLNTIVRTLECGTAFHSVAFSPDAQLVAGRSKDGVVCIWQVINGKLKQKFQGLSGSRPKIVFSENARTLTVLNDEHLEIWNLNGRLMRLSKLKIQSYHRVIDYYGNRIAVLDNHKGKNIVNVLDFTGSILHSIEVQSSPMINSIALSSDGRLLAIRSSDTSVDLYSLEKGEKLDVFPMDAAELVFSFDNRYLFGINFIGFFNTAGFEGKGFVVMDLENKNVFSITIPRLDSYSIGDLSFSRDGKLLWADIYNLHLSQVTSASFLDTIKWPKSRLLESDSAAFSEDGELLIVGKHPDALLIRVSDGRLLSTYYSRINSYTTSEPIPVAIGLDKIDPRRRLLAFSLVASGFIPSIPGGIPSISRPSVSGPLLFLNGLNADVPLNMPETIYSLAFSPNGRLLASGSKNGDIYLIRTSNRSISQTLNHSKSPVNVSFSSSGQFMAAASLDGVIRIWRLSNMQLTQELPKNSVGVTVVKFSRNDKFIATGGIDGLIQIWRTEDGKRVHKLDGHLNPVRAIAFSSDDSVLATGDSGGAIRLWRVSDGQLLKDIRGHTDAVLALTFDGDGRLVTASRDGTIRLWGVK